MVVSLLGLQQSGFLSNLNFLIPWDINPNSNQVSTTNAAAAGAAVQYQNRNNSNRGFKNSRRGLFKFNWNKRIHQQNSFSFRSRCR